GKALELGKRCDVDVLLVHAPDAEKQYVADGYGVNRKPIMYNDFWEKERKPLFLVRGSRVQNAGQAGFWQTGRFLRQKTRRMISQGLQ
ncbi:MAG: hypothetical protein R6U41_10330, partial [Desulfosalsimonas sp.]